MLRRDQDREVRADRHRDHSGHEIRSGWRRPTRSQSSEGWNRCLASRSTTGHPIGRVEPPAQLVGRDHAPDAAPENHDRTTGHQNVITVPASIFEVASSAIDARCEPRAFPGG